MVVTCGCRTKTRAFGCLVWHRTTGTPTKSVLKLAEARAGGRGQWEQRRLKKVAWGIYSVEEGDEERRQQK